MNICIYLFSYLFTYIFPRLLYRLYQSRLMVLSVAFAKTLLIPLMSIDLNRFEYKSNILKERFVILFFPNFIATPGLFNCVLFVPSLVTCYYYRERRAYS